MVDFVELQSVIKERLERDRAVKAVEAEGATPEEAVAQAAALLNLPVRRLAYEVMVRGFAGFMGVGVRQWRIRAYESITEKTLKEEARAEEAEEEEVEVAARDGDFFVQMRREGAFLKVIPPVGAGSPVNEAAVIQHATRRGVTEIDEAAVHAVVAAAAGEYKKVGDFQKQLEHNATVNVSITADEMKANIIINHPGPGGCDVTYEACLSAMRGEGVVSGFREEELLAFVDKPAYGEQFVAAEGQRPLAGRDAYIQYNFETNQNAVRLKEGAGGRVNFKELNIIHNVTAGQPLAVKIPAESGIDGRTITGKPVPAKDGKDMAIPLGQNVRMADDGVTVLAAINGQVLVLSGKINVEPVYTVKGNVDIKTGNIIFLGTVLIKGSVTSGYSVKAAGSIEINGTVEKAELDAEGDIIVHQGITGKSDGIIRSGRSIWAKFIENSHVEAGNMVVVSDGIIHSHVDAFKRIVCKGKRAAIVGGRLRATEEINAQTIGNTAGTETVCEVGFSPKSKEQLDQLVAQKAVLDKQAEEVNLNLHTLINIKKQRKSLPEDKELYLQEMMDKRKEIMAALYKNKEETEEIKVFLSGITSHGRVSASAKVLPGTQIFIRGIKEEVRSDYKAVTFVLEKGLVRATKYEEPDEESAKGPDGYIAN